MRVVAGLAALVLLGGIPAGAQYTPQSNTTVPQSAGIFCEDFAPLVDLNHPGERAKGTTGTVCASSAIVQGCPVDMRVRQRRGGETVEVDANGVQRKVSAQRLRLILNDMRRDTAGMKAVFAIVTVHGTGETAGIQALGPGPSNSRTRSFRVNLSAWGEPGVSGNFLLPGFTSASHVDLVSITYEDGSTWRLSKNESCRVAVDPLMLITQ